jgi:8-oxo-dGTP pyrophosphatase MutT (NUDIX family)
VKLAARLDDIAAGRAAAAEPRDAATIVVVRAAGHGDGAGVEALMLRLTAAMKFAPGAYVFPGGSVDQGDYDAEVGWQGPSPAEFGARFGAPAAVARALVCAAVRETFEESGVLLAGTDSDVLADTSQYTDVRQALVSREVSLAGFLAEAKLTLRSDLLRPWANWLTPEPEPRRYDTRFFVATLPQGQEADGKTSEADSSGWQRAEEALLDAKEGRRTLMPPTWITLTELAEFTSAADILAVERSIQKIMPTLVRDGDQVRVVLEPQ